jgi:hypothetical protein
LKREAVRASAPARAPTRWLIVASGIAALGLAVVGWLLVASHDADKPRTGSGAARDTAITQLAPPALITSAEVAALGWQNVNPLLQRIAADHDEIDRLIDIASGVDTPPASYLQGLLLLSRNRPEDALAVFDTLDPAAIPPDLLYAPHRLQQALAPAAPDPYLAALRPAVADGTVPALIRARVQALDGDLSASLASYMRSDPGGWARYDLQAFRQIAEHQGLAPDLRELVRGALASGRVKEAVIPPLREIARSDKEEMELSAFKRQLRKEIEAQTPAGKIAIESAKQLLEDRQRFVRREYASLLDSHRASEPPELPTESVLLLFLASVAQDNAIETDRWGQELKRRHEDAEVDDWVARMKASAQ